MKLRFSLSIVFLFVIGTCLSAGNKSDKLKPSWLTRGLPESKSGTYIFVRSHGQGPSLSSAKQMAFVAMSQKLELERGLTINTSVQTRERLYQNRKESGNQYEQEIVLEVTEKGRRIDIVCREIDDYWTESNNLYEVDVLFTVADKNKNGGSFDDTITVTSRYGASGLLSIMPSVGQFYKGSIVKGSMILAGELLSIGGIIICENTRASYLKKMVEQPKHASEYNSLANTWETGRNICIGAAAAVFVYNMIDAVVSPGAKRVIVRKNSANLSVIPYADNYSLGMSIAYKF